MWLKENWLYLARISTIFLIALFVSPLLASATSGACSFHSGANCSIGSVNNRAVCNDGWLSSVVYTDMEECVGYNNLCTKYLYSDQYNSTKTSLKNDLTVLDAQIEKLKNDLISLDLQENQAILEYEQSIIGRGVTVAGAQPQINAIHNEYSIKKSTVSVNLNAAIDQYNQLVNQYNSICRKYTDGEKSLICAYNFGSTSNYIGGSCFMQPTNIPTPTSIPLNSRIPSQVEPTNLNNFRDQILKDTSLCKFMPWSAEPECTNKPATIEVKTPQEIRLPTATKRVDIKPIQKLKELNNIVATSSASTTVQNYSTPTQTVEPAQKPQTRWSRIINFFRQFKFW